MKIKMKTNLIKFYLNKMIKFLYRKYLNTSNDNNNNNEFFQKNKQNINNSEINSMIEQFIIMNLNNS